MPLNLDYRPKSFDSIVGNKSTVASLKAIFDRERDWPHAVLLQGPKGCGKTTAGRIIANFLLGKSYDKAAGDFYQMDGGDVNADAVRSIKQQVSFRPLTSKARVWLIEEAHMIGQGGDSEKNIPQNNMLTTVENAPSHVYFILCTTNPKRLLETIRSRCHTFEFQYLDEKDTVFLLEDVLKKEKVEVRVEILKKIAGASLGCPRDALRILDQVIDMESGKMEEAIASFSYAEKQVVDLYNALMKKQDWKRLSAVLEKMDLSNPESARRGIMGLAGFNLMRSGDRIAVFIFDAFKESFYDTGKVGFQMATYRAMVELEDIEPF